MLIRFSGVLLASDGNEVCDVISLSPLARSSKNETLRLIKSRGVFNFENRNAEYSITARVPYFCDSWEAAQRELVRLGGVLDSLDEGDLDIYLDSARLHIPRCVCEADFPDEITGSFFEVSYKFRGGVPSEAELPRLLSICGALVAVNNNLIAYN